MPVFEDAFSVLKNDRKLTEEELIRAIRFMIAAEYEAVQLYNQLAESIDNKMAIKVLNDIADEEKVHAGEFLKLLKILDPKEEEFYQEGEKEVGDMKFSSTNEALQYLADLTGKRIKIGKEEAYMVSNLGVLDNEVYFVKSSKDAKSESDRSAIEEAERLDDTVTMGKIIVTPKYLWGKGDKENFKEFGFNKKFRF